MCGRFTLHHSTEEVVDLFGVEEVGVSFKPRYNIAPTQPVAVVVPQAVRSLEGFNWGLVPFWAKDPKIGSRMINARAETLAEKPSFRGAFKYHRCIIPCSGYYEWKKGGPKGKDKVPTYLYMEDRALFGMAGLWEEWNGPNGEVLHSCTIVTVEANDFAAKVHHRMPLILKGEDEKAWLDPSLQDARLLHPLLRPYRGKMGAHPVSKQVNVPVFDEPECIAEAA
jgi:putative SOS response-associated peptidase YedK